MNQGLAERGMKDVSAVIQRGGGRKLHLASLQPPRRYRPHINNAYSDPYTKPFFLTEGGDQGLHSAGNRSRNNSDDTLASDRKDVCGLLPPLPIMEEPSSRECKPTLSAGDLVPLGLWPRVAG